MGAALTYARRYALFVLVGIAGEDDLDAPDLKAVSNPAGELPRSPHYGQRPSGQPAPAEQKPVGHGKLSRTSVRSVLGEQLSASLRESLVEQMAAINSQDQAAAWAHRNLRAKNSLAAADAKIVEEQFQARLSKSMTEAMLKGIPRALEWTPMVRFPRGQLPIPLILAQARIATAALPDDASSENSTKRSRRSTVSALGKTVRLRDKDHRKFVLRQPCLVCGRVPSDPHHLTFTQPRALGRRVSDEFTVPVCRAHHRELHRSGEEAAWWRRLNIDPLPVARKLCQQSRADGELFPSTEGVTQPEVAKTTDFSAQDRSGTSRTPNTHSGSAV
jgi:hypothetical protein